MKRVIAIMFALTFLTLLVFNTSAIDIIPSDDESNELYYTPLIPYNIVGYQNYDNGYTINTVIIGSPVASYNAIQKGITTDVYNDVSTSISDTDGYGVYGVSSTFFKNFSNYSDNAPYMITVGSYCVSGRLYPQLDYDSSSNAFNRYEITFDDYAIHSLSYLFDEYEFTGKPFRSFDLPYSNVSANVAISFDVETTIFDGSRYKEVSYHFSNESTLSAVSTGISFGDYEFDDFDITDNNIIPNAIPDVNFFQQNEAGYTVKNMSIVVDLAVPNNNATSSAYNTALHVKTYWITSNTDERNGGYMVNGVSRFGYTFDNATDLSTQLEYYKSAYLQYKESSEYYQRLYNESTSQNPMIRVPALFLSAVGDFFSIDFFGMGFTLGHLTFVIALCAVVLIFLKMFAGG